MQSTLDFQNITDPHTAVSLLGQNCRELDWSLAAFGSDINSLFVEKDASGKHLPLLLGWESDQVEEWEQHRLTRYSPFIDYCRSESMPCVWSIDTKENEWPALTFAFKKSSKVFEFLHGAGVKSGVTVPVHQSGGEIGFVSWLSESRIEETQQRYQSQAQDIFSLSHFFMRAFRVKIEAPVIRLTERELMCLNLASKGFTDNQMSEVLCRSLATVKFHMGNAQSKMGAANRAHAVAMALKKGLI